jgi:hypothetical protein
MDLISGQESHEFMVFKYKFFHQKDLGCNHVLGHSNARTKKTDSEDCGGDDTPAILMLHAVR